ncbi:MAG: DUF503 domain-containing protein [Dehalococcoidia bacterium]|nr:DUF503 domain-containing protein [Dehalococcoidia bacterium]MDZ4247261.1 DUF503 domain-containing protein [Dehalococcoidia bacterium]
MNVGVLKIRLRLPENDNLKGKRQVVKSVIARVRNSFNVCIAEVDDLDYWQVATLAVTCVSNNPQHNNEVLSRVLNFIGSTRLDCELLDHEIELIPYS